MLVSSVVCKGGKVDTEEGARVGGRLVDDWCRGFKDLFDVMRWRR